MSSRVLVPLLTILVSLCLSPAAGAAPPPPRVTAPSITPGVPMSGVFEAGDLPLQSVVSGNEGDQTYTDVYTFSGAAGTSVRVSVNATVPVYLALLAPGALPIEDAGNNGEETAPSLVAPLAVTGAYQVVVNSFHGDLGSYTVTVGTEATIGLTTAANLATPLTLGDVTSGTFAAGDSGLEALLEGADGDVTWADAYTFDAFAGQGIALEVHADVPVYHALADSNRRLLAGDGTQGDETDTQIVWVPGADAPLTAIVNSFNGDPGSYTLTVRAATPEELQAVSDGMLVDAVLASGTPLDDVITPSDRIYRTYTVDVPEGASTLTIQTEAGGEIDLFVRQGMQILASWNTEPDFFGTSPGGNEVVRITEVTEPALQPGRYYIDVAALVSVDEQATAPPIPFRIRAELTQTVIPVVMDVAPLNVEGLVTGMFAAQLVPGTRVDARIEPSVSPLQVWTVPVPPDAERLEIRTFSATGRLDVVATPPGMNLPNDVLALFQVPFRALSARDNEHLVIDGRSRPPLQPGNYTVAVLDLYSDAASDYDIAISFDEALGNGSAWTSPDPAEFASLSPLQRAVRSTVQITLSREPGSLDFGSGTILTPDGLILTNHHVIGDCEHTTPHLLGCAGEAYRNPDGTPVDLFIGLGNESQSSAEQHFIAHAIRTLPDYDLALIQIVSDLDGNPVEGSLPSLPVTFGPESVRLGDAVSVIGYPSVAGLGSRISLSMTRGYVTGFTDDRGRRVFVNVDANIGGGNSGGALVNEQGVLIGVPSNSNIIRERGERQDYARALSLVPSEWQELLRDHGADIR